MSIKSLAVAAALLFAAPAWAGGTIPHLIIDDSIEFTSVIVGGVMTINMKDKTITVSPDAKPDEAAQRVIEALRAHIRTACPK